MGTEFFFYMVELARFMVDSLSSRKSRWRCTKYWVTCWIAVFGKILLDKTFFNSTLLQMDRLQLTAVCCNRRVLRTQHLKWPVFAVQKCAVNGYKKELTITTHSLTTSAQLDWKYKSENSILVWYACMVTLHDYTTGTNDDLTTKTVFRTEHIDTNTWVHRPLSVRASSHCTLHRTAQVRAVSVIHPIHMRSWCVRFSLAIDLSILFILYLSHLLSHSFHFLTLKLVESLCTSPKKGMASIDETYSLTDSFIVSWFSINLHLEDSSSRNSWTLFNSSISFKTFDMSFTKNSIFSDSCSCGSSWSRRSCSSFATWSISLRWALNNYTQFLDTSSFKIGFNLESWFYRSPCRDLITFFGKN